MPTALSSETLVNTVTSGDQRPVDLAVLQDGQSVVAWIDQSTGAPTGKLRLIGADGAPASSEILVAATSNMQLAQLEGGGFVVAWTSTDGASSSVRTRTYDATGQPQGVVRELAGYTPEGPVLGYSLMSLDVLGLSDGGYSVAWGLQREELMGFHGVSTRLIVADAQGTIEGDTATSLGFSKTQPLYDPQTGLVELPGGQVLLMWTQPVPLGFSGNQFGQKYDLQGAAVGSQFNFDPGIPGDGGPVLPASVSTAVLPSGDLAITWAGVSGGADVVLVSLYPIAHLGEGIFNGRTLPQVVGTSPGAGDPHVSALSDGRFVISWSSGGDAMARIYSAAGAPEAAAFRLGDISQGAQDLVDLVSRTDGALVAVWRDDSHLTTAGQTADASGTGVKAQVLWPQDGTSGTAGHDVLVGGAQGDVLAGREGDDWLLGLGGADTLSGGAGADKFILSIGGGADSILDYRSGSDYLLLFDEQGRIADGSHGLLTLDPRSGDLSWDPDSDAGATAAGTIAVVPGLATVGRGDLAAGFQPSGVRIMLADGGREELIFDWGTAAFESTRALFDRDGDVVSYEVRNDDGSYSIKWFDSDANQPWDTRVAEYDAQGRLSGYAVTADDLSQTQRHFDTLNQQPWSRYVDEYDAAGRILTRGVVNDDGTYWIARFDAAGVETWSAMIDHYDSIGRVVRHSTIFDDGSVVG